MDPHNTKNPSEREGWVIRIKDSTIEICVAEGLEDTGRSRNH